MKRLILTPIFVLAIVSAACSRGNNQPTSTTTPASAATLVIEPNLTGSTDVNLDDVLQTAKQVLERRATAFGYDSATVERGGNQLVIHLPDIGRDEAAKFLKQGVVEFRELKRDESGDVEVVRNGGATSVPFPTPTATPAPSRYWDFFPWQRTPPDDAGYKQMLEDAVWIPATGKGSDGSDEALTGRYIVKAYLEGDPNSGQPVVSFTFNDEGGNLMQQISQRLLHAPMAFFLDGEPLRCADGGIMASTVQDVVADRVQLTGFKPADAEYLARVLMSGPLPVPFDVVSYESAGGF